MNHFSANFSSSTASHDLPNDTPPTQRNVLFQAAEPASTTPAAPPPSQIFGSSQLDTGVSKLQFGRGTGNAPTTHQFHSSRTRNGTPGRPRSQLFQTSTNSETDDDMEEDYTEYGTEDDWTGNDFQQSTRDKPGFMSINKNVTRMSAPSLLRFSTNSKRQSLAVSTRKEPSRSSKMQLPRKGRADMIPGLVKDLTRRASPAILTETDTVILETNVICRQLDEECQHRADTQIISQSATISGAAQELILLWRRNTRVTQILPESGQVGPMPHEPKFEQARYIATLLLDLYHPQAQQTDESRYTYPSNSTISVRKQPAKPMPQIIQEWIHKNHTKYDAAFERVMTHEPNATASDIFWEAVESLTLRGKFLEAMEVLAVADFRHSLVEGPRGPIRAAYNGRQLQTIQEAIMSARELLNVCPVVQNDDWDLEGQDWDIYRRQVEDAMIELADMANNHDDDDSTTSSQDLLRTTARSTDLPYEVFQHLRFIYSILLGDAKTILSISQDWLEASLMLTAWWNGAEEAKVAQWSFDVSRANQEPPAAADAYRYINRLRESFLCVTDPTIESNYHINTMSPVEVGIGSVLQGDSQGTLRILQTLSQCVASATAEIGSWAGWLSATTPTEGLDQDDLMVLNFGSSDTSISKDDVLSNYSEALFEKDMLVSMEGSIVEGWEIAFAVASRMDDRARVGLSISEFLEVLPVKNQDRTQKLVAVCQELGLKAQGRKVSEAFGDHLVNDSTDYGTALLCYARAHSENKVRQLIDLLNSYCLVQSKAYPVEEEMDDALKHLVGDPKEALQHISEIDPEAAEALQFYLVGYACIRRFYSIRDEATTTAHSKSMTRQARKKVASRALMAAINSAADSMYGGLYDPDRKSAIQVDGVLTLLGEATALLASNEQKRVFTSEQMYALLAAIEDLQTVSDRVYQATEECMEASLRNFHGSQPPSPHAMLKKSVSSGTNSNFSFSMMGSEMLSRSEESLGGKSLGSAVLVNDRRNRGRDDARDSGDERGWDWRARFKDQSATGRDVLQVLRVGIARELSIASLQENEVVF